MLDTFYQQFIHKSRYARWDYTKKRREEWPETITRYFDFFAEHLKKHHDFDLDNGFRKGLEEKIKNLDVMPSMRALMTAGEALEKDNAAGYNCSYFHVDNINIFSELLYLLMVGTGVGFSVEKKFVNKLPEIPDELFVSDTTIIVSDSKLGWAKAFKELIYLLYSGQIPKIDYSRIREAGKPLKTFGGRASGPEPLKELFDYTSETFLKARGRKLKPIECHDILCKSGEITICGGSRRSAEISISDLSDEEMRNAKSGNWWSTEPQRTLANNSANYHEKPDISTFLKEWTSLYNSKSGERGIFSSLNAKKQVERMNEEYGYEKRKPKDDFGCNPCCLPGNTEILTSEGITTIKELYEMDTYPYVYSFNSKTNEIVYTQIMAATKTRENAELVEATFRSITDENVKTIIVMTPDHKVFVKEKGFVPVEEIQEDNDIVILMDENKNYYEAKMLCIKTKDNEDTYDIETGTHSFFAKDPHSENYVLVKNSEILLQNQEFCNLTEIVIRENDTLDTLKEKAKCASILGTFQSTLTNFRFLNKNWKKNCEEERLLGVSLTGIMDHPVMNGSEGKEKLKEWLSELKKTVNETNEHYAEALKINPSAATTTCKPSGTVSALVDSASGIHPRHSKYYIRTIRADSKDPLCKFMIDKGFPYEPDATKPLTTMVFSFPMKSPDSSVCRNDISAIEHLEIWKSYQLYWCEHKPSITVSIKEDEWISVASWVYENFDVISGISFLPFSEHTYRQAPFQDCSKEEYEELLEKIPDGVDWLEFASYEDKDLTLGSQTMACSGTSCELVDLTT